ncbi:MAG: DUF4920 domain-containing protein [Flavobacterium sp.]|nr:DUF4920 domain-containing protein [Flavobacterium sp.]
MCIGLFGCKNENHETAPDPVLETPSDSISRDTLVDNLSPSEAETDVKTIEISAPENKAIEVQYATFGQNFTTEKVLSQEQMLKKYSTLKKGDTIAVKFKSKITEVCKKKGCWMKMDLAGKESFVRFKDYGFFVPLNADNSEAIVNGRAFVDVISVDDLKHYTKDGGETQDAIDKIKEPKITYAFQADGVLIQK